MCWRCLKTDDFIQPKSSQVNSLDSPITLLVSHITKWQQSHRQKVTVSEIGQICRWSHYWLLIALGETSHFTGHPHNIDHRLIRWPGGGGSDRWLVRSVIGQITDWSNNWWPRSALCHISDRSKQIWITFLIVQLSYRSGHLLDRSLTDWSGH